MGGAGIRTGVEDTADEDELVLWELMPVPEGVIAQGGVRVLTENECVKHQKQLLEC